MALGNGAGERKRTGTGRNMRRLRPRPRDRGPETERQRNWGIPRDRTSDMKTAGHTVTIGLHSGALWPNGFPFSSLSVCL